MATQLSEWPEVPADLLDYLEATFPPRCRDLAAESELEHQEYAGQVKLIAVLRAAYERQRQGGPETIKKEF